MHDWWMNQMGSGYGGMWFGPIFMWLPLLLLIVAVAIVLRWFYRDGEKPERMSPRQILDQRFAKGEIDEREYQERRKALE